MRLGYFLLSLTLLITVGCSRKNLQGNDNGAGGMCTLMGCMDGFQVSLTANDGELPVGTYDVWVEVNNLTASHCQIVSALSARATMTGDCTNIDWTYGNFDRKSMANIYYLSPGTDVTNLKITYLKDGALLAQRDLQPVYEFTYPNGERCGGACKNAPAVIIPIDL